MTNYLFLSDFVSNHFEIYLHLLHPYTALFAIFHI